MGHPVSGVLWGLAVIGAVIVTLAVERERVARGNYANARKVMRTSRDIWWRALWHAARIIALAVLVVGCVYLVTHQEGH